MAKVGCRVCRWQHSEISADRVSDEGRRTGSRRSVGDRGIWLVLSNFIAERCSVDKGGKSVGSVREIRSGVSFVTDCEMQTGSVRDCEMEARSVRKARTGVVLSGAAEMNRFCQARRNACGFCQAGQSSPRFCQDVRKAGRLCQEIWNKGRELIGPVCGTVWLWAHTAERRSDLRCAFPS